jgi:hypothetical protein
MVPDLPPISSLTLTGYNMGSLADPALRFGSGPVPGGLIKGDWVLVLSGFKCPLGDLQLNGGVRGFGSGGEGGTAWPVHRVFRFSPFGLS